MYYQPETGTYYDPKQDPQFEGMSFKDIVAKGKPRVLGLSWEEALANKEIPPYATFTGNLTWPQNAYDGTNLDHLVDAMRSCGGTALVGPPGTLRDHFKSEQGDYGTNKDQVGFYVVFKDDIPAPEQP